MAHAVKNICTIYKSNPNKIGPINIFHGECLLWDVQFERFLANGYLHKKSLFWNIPYMKERLDLSGIKSDT